MPLTPDLVAQVEAEYAPKIAAAALAVRRRRDAGFLDAPFSVHGLVVRPMSLADYIALRAAGNAHVCHEPAPEGVTEDKFWALHDAALLWTLSADFTPVDAAREAFVASLAAMPYEDLHTAVLVYLEETFADSPWQGGKGKPGAGGDDPFRISIFAHWLAEVAAVVPWSRAELRALPLTEFFQYLRLARANAAIARKERPKPPSDEIDRAWAAMQTEMMARASAGEAVA